MKGALLVVGLALVWVSSASAEELPRRTYGEAYSGALTVALGAHTDYDAKFVKALPESRDGTCPRPRGKFRCRVDLIYWNKGEPRSRCTFYIVAWNRGWELGEWHTCPKAVPLSG